MWIASGLAELLWPQRCAACDALSGLEWALCRPCHDTLLRTEAAEQRLSFPRPPAWTGARCQFEFGGQLALAIRRAKYGGDSALARLLGRLLRPLPPDYDLAIPVPLHPRRLRARGFNQAAELLRGAGIRPRIELLVRTRDTPPQTDRPLPARLRNVAGAFAVHMPERVKGRRVLLVDDVMTTGATADACARALSEAGSAAVLVLALARAPL